MAEVKKKRPPTSLVPMPLPLDSASSVPVLSEHVHLDADLAGLATAFYADDRPTLRRCAPLVDAMRDRWRVAERPAHAEDIAREAARLAVSVPIAGNIETGVLADAICEEVASLRPSQFELQHAISGVRRRCKFLSVAEVVEELRRARRRAAKHRMVLENDYNEDGSVSFPMKNYQALFLDGSEEGNSK